MKTLIIMIVLLWPALQTARADELENHLARLKEALSKNQVCDIAVVSIPIDPEAGEIQAVGRLIPKEVNCIGNITIGRGTIKEASGCAFFVLDLENLSYRPFMNRLGYDYQVTAKSCDAGGFEDLVAIRMGGYGIPERSVGQWFLTPDAPGLEEVILLHTQKTSLQKMLGQKSKYEEWFEKNQQPKPAQKIAKKEPAPKGAGERQEKAKPSSRSQTKAKNQKPQPEVDVYEADSYRQD